MCGGWECTKEQTLMVVQIAFCANSVDGCFKSYVKRGVEIELITGSWRQSNNVRRRSPRMLSDQNVLIKHQWRDSSG